MKPEFFINNRRKLRERVGPGLIILTANGLMQRSAESTYPFRQDSNFWYVTGLNEPDLTLVMDGDKEYIILPPREEIRNIFDGYIDKQALKDTSGATAIYTQEQGWPPLNEQLKETEEVLILEPLEPFVRGYDFYSNPARRNLKDRLLRTNDQLDTKDIRVDFAMMRVIKHPEELAVMQQAIDITSDTIKEVARKLPKFNYEYEVEAALTQGFRSRGADGHAFSPIVASGKNASTVHYLANNQKIKKNSLLLLDVGAEVNCYSADLSRTIPYSKPTRRQKALLEATKRAQEYAFSLIKPGVNFRAYEKDVTAFMGEEMKKLGLIKKASKKAIRTYFPFATSHFVGLDTHDAGDYYCDFEENMVLAVEPGFLIPEEGIGVRIEDNVVVTKDGCRVLSKNLPALLG